MNINADSHDDLSSHMGTKTLLAHDQVPGALPASSKGPGGAAGSPYWVKVPGNRAKREQPPQLQGV